ncbi:MAG: lysophospholipase [Firmicutes bacterium]|nr:lysophospholipase [Bacillota bacterium]
MKKFFSCLIITILLFALASPALASPEDPTPLIVLQGYSGPQLFLDYGEETEQRVWSPALEGTDLRSLADVLLYVLPKLIVDAGGNAERVVEKFGEIAPLLEKMEMREDGTSKYGLTPCPRGARNSRWDVMLANKQERLNTQRAITESLLDAVPADHVYIFANDWRRGQVEGTANLRGFIQEVKADSGHDKVNLFGVSYGGQLAAAYLALYGGEDIERVLLHAPAIQGSQLAVDIMENEDFAFDPVLLLDFAATYLEMELSLNQRFQGVTMEQISAIALRVLREHVKPIFLKFGSYWDIVPPEDYERLKAKYLDEEANAEIIRRSDIIHYEVMPRIGETLREWQAKGVKIALVCGAGSSLVGGNMVDSDRIIDTDSTTGASVAPLGGEKASAPSTPVCANPKHPHRSPGGAIDASGCYLPDQTWFFLGQYHGQGAWDPWACAVWNKWLYTDELPDVYADPEYPQFRVSCNPADGIDARFSGGVSGWLPPGDGTLLLKNLSSHDLSVLSVKAEGLRLEVPLVNRVVIRPGEAARLRCEAEVPARTQPFTLTVEFVRESLVPAAETRGFTFAAVPGELPEALRYPPLEDANPPPRFQPMRTLLAALSLAASLGVASAAVGVMYKGKLREKKRK